MASGNSDQDARSPGIKFPTDLYERYVELIPHGSRGQVVQLITRLFLDLIEEYGQAAVGALARGAIRFEIDWDKMKQKNSGK